MRLSHQETYFFRDTNTTSRTHFGKTYVKKDDKSANISTYLQNTIHTSRAES